MTLDTHTVERDPMFTSAQSMGDDAGASAGRWVEVTTFADAVAILTDIDPAVVDRYGPPSPLSGEWADDPTPCDVLRAIAWEADLDPDEVDCSDLYVYDDVLDTYCEAFADGWSREVTDAALRRLFDADHLEVSTYGRGDREATYALGQTSVTSYYADGSTAVMGWHDVTEVSVSDLAAMGIVAAVAALISGRL